MAFRFQSWRSCTIRPADEIEAHYAAYILDVAGDALSRKGLLRPEARTGGTIDLAPTAEDPVVVPLALRRP